MGRGHAASASIPAGARPCAIPVAADTALALLIGTPALAGAFLGTLAIGRGSRHARAPSIGASAVQAAAVGAAAIRGGAHHALGAHEGAAALQLAGLAAGAVGARAQRAPGVALVTRIRLMTHGISIQRTSAVLGTFLTFPAMGICPRCAKGWFADATSLLVERFTSRVHGALAPLHATLGLQAVRARPDAARPVVLYHTGSGDRFISAVWDLQAGAATLLPAQAGLSTIIG